MFVRWVSYWCFRWWLLDACFPWGVYFAAWRRCRKSGDSGVKWNFRWLQGVTTTFLSHTIHIWCIYLHLVVFAHVVGTAPWNMRVFALPPMKSYAWYWHDIKLMLRQVRVGCGVGGVMLTFLCTCIMKLMLRHVRVGCGVGAWGDVNVPVHLHRSSI